MQFTIERRVSADKEKVWALISNFSQSPGKGVGIHVLEQGESDGKNLVRTVTIGKMAIKERIDEVVQNESFSYSIIEGPPTKSYKGKAHISVDGDETIINWSGDFKTKIPFTGFIVKAVAKKNVTKYVDTVLAGLS